MNLDASALKHLGRTQERIPTSEMLKIMDERNEGMKVIFCSTMNLNVSEEMKKSKDFRPISGQKFQENLFLGLKANGVDISIVNVPRVRHYPYYTDKVIREKPFIINGENCGISLGIINLKWINYISAGVQLFRHLLKIIFKNKGEKIVFLFFNMHVPQTLILLLLQRIYANVTVCEVIGDLHGAYGVKNTRRGLHSWAIARLGNWLDKSVCHFDSFVLLTEEMAQALRLQDKPYTIMEGFYLPESGSVQPFQDEKQTDEKTIFYAGYLGLDYGVEHMLRAFSQISDPDYLLILAGYGEDTNVMCQYMEKDDRIHFLGFISPSNVAQWQKKATVLISPRTSEYPFVKYSFPSKTLECLASGKPYIAHQLPCDPPEYAEYIQYAHDESDEALRDKIVEICSLPAEERQEIGRKAREFILREKNPKSMCRRIVDLWETIGEKEVSNDE